MSQYSRMLNTNLTLLRPVSLRSQFAIAKNGAKKKLYYFRKTLYRRCLRELRTCLRFWIYQGSKYGSGTEYVSTGVIEASECAWMLNTNSTLLRPVSLRSQFTIFENKAKKNLHYFRQTLYRGFLRKMWICLRFWIYQGSEYGSGFQYARVLHIPGFGIWQFSECTRVLNVPEYPWIIPE